MAHTLTITNGSTVINLALAGGLSGLVGAFLGADGGNSGYVPGTPSADISYSASLYRDGQKPSFSRFPNVFDELEVTVSERSANDVYSTIGKIKKALADAKNYSSSSVPRLNPVYLSLKPHGTTNTGYSIIYSGSVDESIVDNESLINGLMKIKIRLEREPFFRSYPPYRRGAGSSSESIYGGTIKPWGTYEYTSVVGHLPAFTNVTLQSGSGSGITIDKVVVAFRSKFTGVVDVYKSDPLELETWTMGTNCSSTTDATASPGGAGNTKVRCTFGTKTDSKRLSVQTSHSYFYGKYRAFLRVKCASANSVTAYLKYYFSWSDGVSNNNGVIKSTTPMTFTNTSWAMIDMGVLQWPTIGMDYPEVPTPTVPPVPTVSEMLELWASATTTANVDFDFLILIPCDEYYATLSGMNATDNYTAFYVDSSGIDMPTYPQALTYLGKQSAPTATGAGSLFLPVGGGTLIWLTGDSSWQNVFTSTDNCYLQWGKCERYLTARGSG